MSLRAFFSEAIPVMRVPFCATQTTEHVPRTMREIASSLGNAPRNDICTVENNQFQGNQNVK
jgi:hypothetical protein